jgi:hypothetical protein
MVPVQMHLHERFLHMLHVRCRILQQAFSVAQVCAEGRPLERRMKAPPQSAMLMQLLEPLGIVHVCLPPWDILDMPGVDQQDLYPAGCKHLKDGNPVNADGLQGDGSNTEFD